MPEDVRIGLISLDTSHSVEFSRRLHAPDCPPDQQVSGARVVAAYRQPSAFMPEAGQDERQQQLEAWGLRVTRDFDEAVADCDALLLELNDPADHLEMFRRCAELGLPLFLDKPLADTAAHGRAILALGAERGIRWCSCSSLRLVPELAAARELVPEPQHTTVYGPLGQAAAGSSIIWYGVHAVEMLQRAMGVGATAVFARRDGAGVVAIVDYPDGRRGVVELTEGAWIYGGSLRTSEAAAPFASAAARLYSDLLEGLVAFFRGEPAPASPEDALEVLALLEAAERSTLSGQTESLG